MPAKAVASAPTIAAVKVAIASKAINDGQKGLGGVLALRGLRRAALALRSLSHFTVLGVAEVLSNSSNTKTQSRLSIKLGHYRSPENPKI